LLKANNLTLVELFRLPPSEVVKRLKEIKAEKPIKLLLRRYKPSRLAYMLARKRSESS
jgi:hypothetical protein